MFFVNWIRSWHDFCRVNLRSQGTTHMKLLPLFTAWCFFVVMPAEAAPSPAAKDLLRLEKRVAASPRLGVQRQVKRAILELAVERAGNALDVGLKEDAQGLMQDIENALAKPAVDFTSRNPNAEHLAILKPLLTKRDNPYLDQNPAEGQDAGRSATSRSITSRHGLTESWSSPTAAAPSTGQRSPTAFLTTSNSAGTSSPTPSKPAPPSAWMMDSARP